MTEHKKTTLVLGGTGKTGRRVAARLAARACPCGSAPAPARPRSTGTTRPPGRPCCGTWRRRTSCTTPDLTFPGAAEAIRAFAGQAAASGVRRLVLLSGRGEEGSQRSEQGVRRSGAEWTILRASWFSQDFSEDFLLEPVRDGEIAVPAGDMAEPFVDCEDIADVAVAALTEDGHSGRVYELTGPRLLTFADAASEIAKATGREIRYLPVSPEQYAAELAKYVPAEHVAMLTELFTSTLDGRNAHLADGVRRALGRPARDFTDFVRDAAASGVWDA